METILSILIPVWNQEELIVRALDHLPRRNDVEILVRDDGSTDGTLEVVTAYKEAHPEMRIAVYANGENIGLYATMNRLLADAKGAYFHQHNSDDYVDTEAYNRIIDGLGKEDIVCMDLRINDGTIWPVTEETAHIHCAQAVRMIRKEFVRGIAWNEQMKAASDWYFAEELLRRNPSVKYTREIAYMYNFPREGSLVNLRAKGIIGE